MCIHRANPNKMTVKVRNYEKTSHISVLKKGRLLNAIKKKSGGGMDGNVTGRSYRCDVTESSYAPRSSSAGFLLFFFRVADSTGKKCTKYSNHRYVFPFLTITALLSLDCYSHITQSRVQTDKFCKDSQLPYDIHINKIVTEVQNFT